MDLQPLLLSFRVATVSTIVVLVIGLGMALLLARTNFWGKQVVETLVTLPLVLPPSVIGYYLLYLVGRNGVFGGTLDRLGWEIVFTWVAAVIASAVVSMPLMVRTTKAAIESVDADLEKAARTLGASEWRVIADITLPLASKGIVAGLVLAFARGLGEFGATLMVAGNIPGKTQTMPVAIYSAVQSGNLAHANLLVLIMTGISFVVLLAVNRWQQGWLR